jgi:hypothetical protein
MTNSESGPGDDRTPSSWNAPDAPAARPASFTAELFRKSLLVGSKYGMYTSPVTGYITLMLSAVLIGDADGFWLFGLVAVVLGSPIVVGAGAVIGFIAGAGSACALLVALRMEAGATWRLGTAGRVLAVVLGTALAVGAIAVPLAATVLSSFYAAPITILVLSVLVAAVVAAYQGTALEQVRLQGEVSAA